MSNNNMKGITNNQNGGDVYYIFLISSILMCITFSQSCIFRYVPDSEENDPIKFPWEEDQAERERIILDDCRCGTQKTSGNSTPEEIPWIALIKIHWPEENKNNRDTYCSGTLVNSKFILTAYSCFIRDKFSAFDTWGPIREQDVMPENITVWINITDNGFDPDANSSSEGMAVTEIIYDKRYVVSYIMKGLVADNVALLKLEKEIEFGDSFVPICLNPIIHKITSGTAAKAYGWLPTSMLGSKTVSAKTSKSLINDGIPIMDREDCSATSAAEIADGHICINELAGKKKIEGFGAPLVLVSKSKGTLLQVGILSWNDTVAQKNQSKGYHHLFYTTIESAMPFINFYSGKHNATWCKEPEDTDDFFVRNSSKMVKSLDTILSAPWDWVDSTSSNRKKTTGCTCGMHNGAQGRIVGGVDASPHEFKWQVLLRITIFADAEKQQIETKICGGTLVNDRMILLAAHCVVQSALLENEKEMDSPVVKASNVEVLAYVHLKNNDPEAMILKVKRILSHPGYIAAQMSKPPYFDWDVALLELTDPIKFKDDKIIPICLPETEDKLEIVGKSALVTGWGLTDSKNSKSLAATLQKIEIPVQNISFCRNVALDKITDQFICAGTLNRNKDSAQGDSGGPLTIIGSKPNQYIQIGIVSFGEDIKGSINETAALYTDVQAVLSFIDYYSNEVGAEWCQK